jgi:hypothetical protein
MNNNYRGSAQKGIEIADALLLFEAIAALKEHGHDMTKLANDTYLSVKDVCPAPSLSSRPANATNELLKAAHREINSRCGNYVELMK